MNSRKTTGQQGPDELPFELEAPVTIREMPRLQSLPCQPPPTQTPQNQLDESSPETSNSEEQEWVSGFELIALIAGCTLVVFLMLLDTTVITTAIPQITDQFQSLQDVGWYGSSYQLASSVLLPLTGKIYQSFGTKWTFLCFFAIFEIGSLVCGVASSSMMLIIGRTVAGIGGSGIQNGALIIIAECAPMPKRPALTGFMLGVSQVGVVAGPLIGGVLTQYTTWRWCFYINLPAGIVVATLLCFIRIPNHCDNPMNLLAIKKALGNLDLIGFLLFIPAVTQFLLALQYGGDRFPWASATIIGLFCGSGCTLLAFLLWEHYKADNAMIPFFVVRKTIIWSSCLVSGFLKATSVCALYYLPIYFQAVKNKTPMMSGVYIIPTIVGQLLGTMLSGRLVERVGYYLPFTVTGGVISSIGCGLVSTFTPDTTAYKWVCYQFLSGLGRGIAMQMPIIAVQMAINPYQIPVAVGLVMFGQSLMSSIFLSSAAVIFNGSLKRLLTQYSPSIDAQIVISAGATAFRGVIPTSQVANVVMAYSKSLDCVFYLVSGAAVMVFVFSWGTGWENIKKENSQTGAA